ncbi:hypothetical protein JL721_8521 [Aureococcus anophagefferens]|nr:hypothetical protein JL721_8521 [Aureococcus anophagefferens]
MSIRIETHVGREETMKWGPPLSTVVPDIGELPTYDGLKHRTFETRDEATRRPPYAVFEVEDRSGRRMLGSSVRGPVNLAVFASEIPRFAGPIVVTPASIFARDKHSNIRRSRDARCARRQALGPGRTTLAPRGVPSLGELRQSSSFADGTLRDMWGTWRTLDARSWCNSHGARGKQPGLDHIGPGPRPSSRAETRGG